MKLQKNLSAKNVFSLALGAIIGWGCFVLPGNKFLQTAGPLGTVIGLFIGAVIMVIIAYSYGFMTEKCPVSGGEFAFTYIGFGRNHSFICAWFLGLAYLTIVPLNATALGLIFKYMFPGVVQVGYLYSVSGWEIYLGEIILSSLVIIFFGYMNIKGTKLAGKVQTIITYSLIGAIVLLFLGTIFNSNISFSNLTPGFSPEVPPISGILAIVAIAPWAYVGFDCIPQVAEEFEFSTKKVYILMVVAIGFGFLMYAAVNTLTAIVFPWYEFISSKPTWATGMAVKEVLGILGLALLGVSLLSAIIAGINGFYLAASRLLFAMARAKALPEWFGKIHNKYNTPYNAIIFVMIVSLLTPWFGREALTWIVDMSAVGSAIGYLYTCLAAFKLANRENTSRKNNFVKGISFTGALFSIGFLIILLVPGMPGFLSLNSWIALIIWCGLGGYYYLKGSSEFRKIEDKKLENLILNYND